MAIISSTSLVSHLSLLTPQAMEKFRKKLESKVEAEAHDAKLLEMKDLKGQLASLETQLNHTKDPEKIAKLLSAIAAVSVQISQLTVAMSFG